MHLVHRFHDLLIGGAEVVILNTVKALSEWQHTLLFSKAAKSWIVDELNSLPNVALKIISSNRPQDVSKFEADYYLFHFYPPMNCQDLEILPPRILGRSIIINHWHEPVPLVSDCRYLFLSNQSMAKTGLDIPESSKSVLLNPVADRFFRVPRQPIPFSVGRHSRDVLLKYSSDFFELHESIMPTKLRVLILGAPKGMQEYVRENLSALRNHYYLLGLGTLAVPNFLSMPEIYLYKTSDSFAETCPMNILESMAAGLPIIAENKGGIPDLIASQQTGILCDSNDCYIAACNELFENRSMALALGQSAQQWASENASMQVFKGRFLEFLA